MRVAACGLAWVLFGLASAQKPDLVTANPAPFQPGAGLGITQIVQMVLALAVVLGAIKFLLPRLAPMLSKRLNTALSSSIKIEESATFAGGTLYVVSARSRTLLLSCSQSGVQCLADLTEPKGSEAEEPAFFELVDEAASRPIQAAAWIEEPPAPALDTAQAKEALRRLQRLVN